MRNISKSLPSSLLPSSRQDTSLPSRVTTTAIILSLLIAFDFFNCMWKSMHSFLTGFHSTYLWNSFILLLWQYLIPFHCNIVLYCVTIHYLYIHSFLFFFFLLSRATLETCGGSQARGQIGATTAGLRHSHSNTGSKPHLQPTPQLTTMPDL